MCNLKWQNSFVLKYREKYSTFETSDKPDITFHHGVGWADKKVKILLKAKEVTFIINIYGSR